MQPANKKILLDYSFFALVAALIVIISMLIYIFYNSVLNSKILTSKSEARIIKDTITESFNYTNQINSYIGGQIANHKTTDLNFILKLFHDAEKIRNKNSQLLTWSYFDWVDKNNYQTVNSRLGIRKNPPDMSARKFTITAPKNPWTLQISFPVLGNPSNIWAIPAGTGITDEKGNFLGTIVVGINVDEFTERLKQKLNKNLSFVILDEDLNIIMQSSDNSLDRNSDFYHKNFQSQADLFSKQSGILKNKIEVGDINYLAYEKISDYPYFILTGFNKNFLRTEFNRIILPRLLEFIGLTIFFLIILYFFKTRIISLLETEIKLRDDLHQSNFVRSKLLKSFSGSLSHELRTPFSTIHGFLELIKINLALALKNPADKNNILIPLSDAKESLEYLAICNDVIDQGNMVIDLTLEKIHDKPIDKSKFSPNSILETINQTLKQYAFQNADEKEKIIIDIDEESDFIYLGIKNMMLFVLFNLIKNSLYYSVGRKEFKIIIFTSKKNDFNYLHFKDNGPGIDESVVSTIFNNFITHDKIGGTGLGLPFCKRTMKDFGGTIECISKPGFGAEFIMGFSAVK